MSKLYDQNRDIEGDELRPFFMRHLDAMTTENLHSKSAIAAELAHRDFLLAQINDAGTRPHRSGEGVVLQSTTRSAQLESIAESVRQLSNHDHGFTARAINGWAEQLLIIADELKAAGK